MMKKIDGDGKLITALLVGIGLILVILQTIKWPLIFYKIFSIPET